MHQRMGLNLRLQSLRGGPGRSTVLRARGRGTSPHSRARSTARPRALLRSHRGLRHIQTNTQSRKRNKSFIVELESEKIKMWRPEQYFRLFLNGMANTIIEKA